jgi:hypothetical protein
MNAVITNQIAQELARDQQKAVKASTDAVIKDANTHRRGAGFSAAPSTTLSLGEITQAGLEACRDGMQRSKESRLSDNALRIAAGISAEREEAPTEKELERKALLDRMVKAGNPERLFQQLCAGVATRNPDTGRPYVRASTARWLAQGITNAVCRMAGDAIIERMRESGLTAGIHFQTDDTGVFIGEEATNTDDLEIARGGQQTTENLFLQHCDDRETIEGTFLEWFDSIELALGALANAVMMADGASIMLYGHYCRWEDGPKGTLVQRIDTLEDYLERELIRRNDRPGQSRAFANNEVAKLFG